MKKEDILAASRKENKNQDLYEVEVLLKAGRIAYIAGCCLCMLICILQYIFSKTINWGCWVVNFGILGTVFLVKSVKLKSRHEIILTVVYYLICAFFIVGFVMSMR